MSVLTIPSGAVTSQDPSDILVYLFDWDSENLAPTVIITSSVFTLTLLRGNATPALTKDQESVLASNRQTQLRLQGGSAGSMWEVANKIVTNESPAQTKERSFRLVIENQ